MVDTRLNLRSTSLLRDVSMSDMSLLCLNGKVINLSGMDLLKRIHMSEGLLASLFRGHYLGIVEVDFVHSVVDLGSI